MKLSYSLEDHITNLQAIVDKNTEELKRLRLVVSKFIDLEINNNFYYSAIANNLVNNFDIKHTFTNKLEIKIFPFLYYNNLKIFSSPYNFTILPDDFSKDLWKNEMFSYGLTQEIIIKIENYLQSCQR